MNEFSVCYREYLELVIEKMDYLINVLVSREAFEIKLS